MPVIRPAVAVFARGAAKLRYRDYDRVFSEIAEIGPESRNRLRKVAEHICDLSLSAALVDVVIPAADVEHF